MNEMQDNTFCGWGWIIFIILILWFFIGNRNGFINNAFAGNGNGSDCNGLSNCQVERQTIINTANTQYLIEQRTHEIQDNINANINAKYTADQAEKLFDCKMNALAQQNAFNLQLMQKDNTIERLQLMASFNNKFDTLSNQIQSLNCSVLKKPEISGVGVSCPSAAILNGLGVNSLNPYCSNNVNIA